MNGRSHILQRLAIFFAQANIAAYLVGGCVRDWLLGRATNDLDIALDGDPLSLGRSLAMELGGTFVILDQVNPTARVILPGPSHIDLTQLRGGSILSDLARRDFTINALALPLTSEPLNVQTLEGLIDPFHGREDLQAGIIRAVDEASFLDDPLRLLRAIRFAAEFRFHIDPDTQAQIRRHAQSITVPAPERVRDELARILAASDAAGHLRLLDRLGLLAGLLPEVTALKGVTQPPEHYWDVYEHSLQTVAALEDNVQRLNAETSERADVPQALCPWAAVKRYLHMSIPPGGHKRLTMLKFAALLHDVAKPRCKTLEPNGRIRFIGHEKEGAQLARGILQRLRFSSREASMVEIIIRHHMRPAQLMETPLTRRAIYRYFRDTGHEAISILFLSLADHRATGGPALDLSDWLRHLDFTWHMLLAYYQEPQRVVAPPRLLTGYDVMTTLGIGPGKQVGMFLEEIREAQAAGQISTKDEALELLRSMSHVPDHSASGR